MNSIEFILQRIANASRIMAKESGQTLAEYSLILTLVAVGVVTISVVFFSSTVAGTFDSVTACFNGAC